MKFFEKNKNAIFISILFLFSFIIRVYYLPSMPLSGDEAVYGQMIDEFIKNPTIVPHFMGHITAWKPPLGFAVYSFFIYIMRLAAPGLPAETAYRVPPLIFGVLSTLALYQLGKKLYGEDVAFLASLIFAINPASIMTSGNLFLESMVLFLLILGMLLYIEGERDNRYMYLAGFAGFLLFMTKSIIAFLLPALAIAYYLGDKKIGHDTRMGRSFLISLAGVPAAMILYTILFQMSAPIGKGGDISISYIYDMFFRVYGGGDSLNLFSRTIEFLKLMLPWSIMFFGGLLTMRLKNREDRFIYIWLVLMLVFLAASQFYDWYFLQIVPPFSIVCANCLVSIKRSRLFIPVLLLLLVLSIPTLTNPDFMNPFLNLSGPTAERVEVGHFLQNKTGITSITEDGIQETIFYKFHGESAPNYSGFTMKIIDPYSPGGYTGYPVTEIAMGVVNNTYLETAKGVRDFISNSSNKEYVLMDYKTYTLYSSLPLQNYSLDYNSSQGGFIVLKRVT